jgi:hypothetical protein
MSPAVAESMSSFSSAALLALAAVQVELALGERALVDAHVGDLAEGLFNELEGHPDKRRIGVRGERSLGHAVEVVLGHNLAVERTRKVAVHGVKQGLHPLVLVGRAEDDRADGVGDRGVADRVVDQIEGDFLLLEQELHDPV